MKLSNKPNFSWSECRQDYMIDSYHDEEQEPFWKYAVWWYTWRGKMRLKGVICRLLGHKWSSEHYFGDDGGCESHHCDRCCAEWSLGWGEY